MASAIDELQSGKLSKKCICLCCVSMCSGWWFSGNSLEMRHTVHAGGICLVGNPIMSESLWTSRTPSHFFVLFKADLKRLQKNDGCTHAFSKSLGFCCNYGGNVIDCGMWIMLVIPTKNDKRCAFYCTQFDELFGQKMVNFWTIWWYFLTQSDPFLRAEN